MTFNLETVRKIMGWCPKMSEDRGKYPVSFNDSKSFSQRNENILSSSLSLFYKNIYVGGLVKETIIGLIAILTIFFLSDNSLIQEYKIELLILSLVLTQFALSRSNIEINDKFIRVSTLFHWITGSTTHSFDSIKTISIEKNFKWTKYLGFLFFVMGLFYILLILRHLFAGRSAGELTSSIAGIIFCFGLGYITYVISKPDHYIKISFSPYSFINSLYIYAAEARNIANLLEQAGRDSGNIGRNGEMQMQNKTCQMETKRKGKESD